MIPKSPSRPALLTFLHRRKGWAGSEGLYLRFQEVSPAPPLPQPLTTEYNSASSAWSLGVGYNMWSLEG